MKSGFTTTRKTAGPCLFILVLCAWSPPSVLGQTTNAVRDVFGRAVNDVGVTLVDWEGHIANPAIRFAVEPPPHLAYPITVRLSAPHPRLYFDLPSTFGGAGPSKTLTLATPLSPAAFHMSIWPDRDGLDESYALTVTSTGVDGTTVTDVVPIRVIDEDRDLPGLFDVILDWRHDRTGFFDDAATREVIERGADDWAYFIDDLRLDETPAGTELTWIWDPTGFISGRNVQNVFPYRGFLLYAYGIDGADLRSGGEGSANGGFQSSQGTPLEIRRSGGTEIEVKGNYNRLGWRVSLADDEWWVSQNRTAETNDLYSIARHEIGHALFFSGAYPRFAAFRQQGFIDTPELLAYQGAYPKVDASAHFAGEVDRASRKGAFGNDYSGSLGTSGMPLGRWITTKLDLLCAQAVGYRLRPTSPFAPLAWMVPSLEDAVLHEPYRAGFAATGGLRTYDWTIDSGGLPPGLSLDSFTGEIAGAPADSGVFFFRARLRDQETRDAGLFESLSLAVRPSAEARITVTAPAAAASWEAGETKTVSWTSAGAIASVKIEASLDGGATFTTIAESAPNTGAFAWSVPETSSDAAFVKVSDTAGKAADANDRAFRIFKPLYSPLNARGTMRQIRGLFIMEYANELAWDVNPMNRFDRKVRVYLVEGLTRTLLAELDRTKTTYLHRAVLKTANYAYEIVAVDEEGRESAAASIRI